MDNKTYNITNGNYVTAITTKENVLVIHNKNRIDPKDFYCHVIPYKSISAWSIETEEDKLTFSLTINNVDQQLLADYNTVNLYTCRSLMTALLEIA